MRQGNLWGEGKSQKNQTKLGEEGVVVKSGQGGRRKGSEKENESSGEKQNR